MPSGTISAGLASGLIAFAAKQGVSVSELVRVSGLVGIDMADPDARVSMDSYVRLMAAAKVLTGLPALPLLWAEAVGMADLSIVGLVMECSATMGDAFLQLQRYGRLAMDKPNASQPAFTLRQAGDRLFMDARGSTGEDFDLVEAALIRLACGPRKFLSQPHVLSVSLRREAPSFAAEYERIFRCPVHFDAEVNALELHPEIIGWPIPNRSGYLASLLSERADRLLADLDARPSWRARTEDFLEASLHLGAPGVERVARSLGVSRQTLFRRLREESTTFADVLDNTRARLAAHYIGDRGLGITETAFLLGFVEPASFTRAFKRWTGSTPSRFATRSRLRGASVTDDMPHEKGQATARRAGGRTVTIRKLGRPGGPV